MKSRPGAAWAVLILICMLPAISWYFLRPVSGPLFSYSNFTHALGQIFALVGMTMFTLTFILAMRLRFIEDSFGGLDKVYIVHGIMGASALILLLFHPILLVLKFVPGNMQLAAIYLLPGSYWSVNFGIIALTGLIALIFVTLYSKIKYQKWKFSHEFLGLFFIAAVIHVFWVRASGARDYIFSGYYIYAALVSIIGLYGFFYSLIVRKKLINYPEYRIESINKKGTDFFDIVFSPEGKPISFRSGQFIFVRFKNNETGNEAHPFSIASRSNNPKLRIVVKNLGDFTGKLGSLKVGDTAIIEGPYGRFNFHNQASGQVWVAGGIGITPFIGMAQDLLGRKSMQNRIILYYCVAKQEDFINFNELKKIEKSTNGNFKFIPWVSAEKGRLSVDAIKKDNGNISGREFYLCGPKEFKASITKGLVALGISRKKIYEEEFSFK